MPPWGLIDVSWLAYRARHSFKGLSFEEMDTGVLFGFFNVLMDVGTDPRLQTNKLALFFDSHESVRRESFPAYKEKRIKRRTEEELVEHAAMHRQLKLLRQEILPEIGWPTYRQLGMESDDLIAQAAAQINNAGQQAVIITSDKDLYQCIRLGVHWYDPSRQLYLDPLSFYAKTELKDPEDWVMVKCLSGCKTDEVPGVAGVGDKTAVDYILGSLKPDCHRRALIESPSTKKVIRRNMRLVKLPHKLTRPVELRDPEYDHEAFFKWCKRLGFESILERRNHWRRFFEGDFKAVVGTTRKRGETRK